ncbi:hypothetical protein ES319_D11G361500v1 [Gossypium barbadense]|uniref:Uncharacterized protein n=1 Tax=Gossypium barbadense TaxID=3634 RepID=A0A5J5PLD8_GOSBA|nr:hypothetical protein ES319_D11G361500v1 [Gossypium barbadense]
MYGIISLQSTDKKCTNGTHKCEKRPTSPKKRTVNLSWISNPHIFMMIMYLQFNMSVNHQTGNQNHVHLLDKLSHFFITPQSIV